MRSAFRLQQFWIASKTAGVVGAIFSMRFRLLAVMLVVAGIVVVSHAASRPLRGTVHDTSRAPIAGADVWCGSAHVITNSSGQFEIERLNDFEALRVSAPGFASIVIPNPSSNTSLDLTLNVSRVEERITVSENTTPAGVTTFSSQELIASPQISLDTVLRSVPGFSLFRRTPSWSANGTASGVTLRGVGATAASRALVVLDGVPINDPFGGWVYWGRVSPQTLESAEVIEGAASNLYGSDALGGVVNLTRNASQSVRASVEGSIGNLYTPSGAALVGFSPGGWNISTSANAFRTNGYVPVPESLRGSADSVLNSNYQSGSLEIGRRMGLSSRAFLRGSLYGESRQNGTQLQTNSATLRDVVSGFDWSNIAAGSLSLRVFGGTESLYQTFSSISTNRNTETLTRDQSVPVEDWGGTLLWSRQTGKRNMLVAGADTRWVSGESFEWAYTAGTRTSIVRAGGTQRRAAVFGEDRLRLGRLMTILSARVDHWNNYDAFSSLTPLTASSAASFQHLNSRDETAFSPKLSFSYTVAPRLQLNASLGRSFRTPTLNELYRSFRVGNVLTLNNSDLKSERLTGWELGATINATQRDVIRTTTFWNWVNNPVQNVTLTTTPSLITRQKQNAGQLRSRGVEIEWESHFTRQLSLNTAYQFTDSIVTKFNANPALIGLWIPQVARHSASIGLRYSNAEKFTVAAYARAQGRQYDDDQNLFPLGSYAVIDAYFSHRLTHSLQGFIAGENLTNRRYEVGRTPVLTVGPPIVARVGLRWTWAPGH